MGDGGRRGRTGGRRRGLMAVSMSLTTCHHRASPGVRLASGGQHKESDIDGVAAASVSALSGEAIRSIPRSAIEVASANPTRRGLRQGGDSQLNLSAVHRVYPSPDDSLPRARCPHLYDPPHAGSVDSRARGGAIFAGTLRRGATGGGGPERAGNRYSFCGYFGARMVIEHHGE